MRATPGSIAQSLGVFFVFLLVLEMACRVEDALVFGIPLFSPISQNDLVLKDSLGARGRPNARYGMWRLDSLGFRGPEVRRDRVPGSFRVVVEGASESFGLYESAGREFPRQLEDSLRSRRRRACGLADVAPIEVVNGALPGMGLPTIREHLHRMIAPLHPDVVVLYPSPAFYMDVYPPVPAQSVMGADTVVPARNALRLRFVPRLVGQLKGLAPTPVLTWLRQLWIRNWIEQHPEIPRMTSVPPERLAQFERDLREAVGAIRAIGAQAVIMGNANATMKPAFNDRSLLIAWERQFPNSTGEALARFHILANEAARRVAGDSSTVFVALAGAFEGRWQGSFADFVHFTDAGAAVVASALVQPVLDAAMRSDPCSVRSGTR